MFTIIRTGGLTAEFDNDIHWRWSRTPEQLLVAQPAEEPAAAAPAAQIATAARTTDWLGFRGSQRDSIIRGVRIKTDWSASPPVQLWRRPVGPGWSSFAVQDGRFYTQEQRGDDEIVACHDVASPVLLKRSSKRSQS